MLSFLLVSLLQDITAQLPCSNQTITLGKVTNKNENPSWQLSNGPYDGNQNCRYQINIPRLYSAEVTVDLTGFDDPHLLSISDSYGATINTVESGSNASFSLDFPYPSVTIVIRIGVTIVIRIGDVVGDPPIINNLTIRSIQRRPFTQDIMLPLSPQVDASFRLIPVDQAVDPVVIFLGDLTENTSLMFKSNNDPNITLHTLYYSSFEVKIQLINIHIYTYDDSNLDNFYIVGTLFAPQILTEMKKEAICLFISKSVQQEIFLMVTSDQNTNYYSNWQLSYSLSPDRPIYLGPEFCLNATDGPAAYTVYSNLTVFGWFHSSGGLTNLIVTSINSSSDPFPPVKLHTTFPRHPSLMQPVYTFTDSNQLPQKAYSNVKTFVIESGDVCITTNFNAIQGRWNIAYPKRRGFNIAQTPLWIGPPGNKEFHFFSENGTTNHHWKLNIDLSKSTLDGSRCDINYTYINQTTSTQLLLNYSNPSALKSLEFDAERVDAVLRPVVAGTFHLFFPISMFLLFFLLFSGSQTATIKCKNETIALGKKNLNQWNLTGSLSANRTCVYKITVPTFSAALVTVKVKQFSEGHQLTISDQFGATIQNEGDAFDFVAEMPDVTIRLVVGSYDDETTAPLLEELSVENVPYPVFEPPYDQSSADLTADVVLTGKKNTSILFSSTTNVLLSVFSMESPNLDLLNVHVYSFTNDWTLVGTLYFPFIWQNHSSKHLGIFITRRIESVVAVIATSDTNLDRYRGWSAAFAIVDQEDTSRGPSFCLDSEDGPEAITVYTTPREYQQMGLELSDLIVTAIEGNYTSLSVLDKLPTKLGNPNIYWTFGPAVGRDELPQLLFGNVKTFVIEGGHACVNTSNSPVLSGWRQPRNGRTGVIRISSTDERYFFFKAEDNSSWAYNFTFVIEGLPYGQCDLDISLAGNTTRIRMTNFPNDPLNSVVFDSEYVNGTLSTGYSQALTVVFSMTGSGENVGYFSEPIYGETRVLL